MWTTEEYIGNHTEPLYKPTRYTGGTARNRVSPSEVKPQTEPETLRLQSMRQMSLGCKVPDAPKRKIPCLQHPATQPSPRRGSDSGGRACSRCTCGLRRNDFQRWIYFLCTTQSELRTSGSWAHGVQGVRVGSAGCEVVGPRTLY